MKNKNRKYWILDVFYHRCDRHIYYFFDDFADFEKTYLRFSQDMSDYVALAQLTIEGHLSQKDFFDEDFLRQNGGLI